MSWKITRLKNKVIYSIFTPIFWLILAPCFVIINAFYLIFEADYTAHMEIHRRDPYRRWVLYCLKINRFIKRKEND